MLPLRGRPAPQRDAVGPAGGRLFQVGLPLQAVPTKGGVTTMMYRNEFGAAVVVVLLILLILVLTGRL